MWLHSPAGIFSSGFAYGVEIQSGSGRAAGSRPATPAADAQKLERYIQAHSIFTRSERKAASLLGISGDIGGCTLDPHAAEGHIVLGMSPP